MDEAVDSRKESNERGNDNERTVTNAISHFKGIVAWCKRRAERIASFALGHKGNKEQNSNTGESSEASASTFVSSMCGDSDDNIEETIQVNNMVVDNELGGSEVTVLLSLKNNWNGLRKRAFEPIRCLQTARVMLNTLRLSSYDNVTLHP